MSPAHATRALAALVNRELLRFVHQRSRFFSALVRPLLWLVVFAAGFRATLGISIIAPYETYVTYDVYIIPGLIGMVQLFNGMQSSLSMVYDREVGSMRVLLTTPLPRPYLLFAKVFASVAVSLLQVYAFLALAALFGVRFSLAGYVAVLPALVLCGFMFGAVGLVLSSMIRQLENFAGVMNFVIFPAFFLSSALYPIWRMRETSDLIADVSLANPFTHAVEVVRFALYGKVEPVSLAVVAAAAIVAAAAAAWSYDPARWQRRGGAPMA